MNAEEMYSLLLLFIKPSIAVSHELTFCLISATWGGDSLLFFLLLLWGFSFFSSSETDITDFASVPQITAPAVHLFPDRAVGNLFLLNWMR